MPVEDLMSACISLVIYEVLHGQGQFSIYKFITPCSKTERMKLGSILLTGQSVFVLLLHLAFRF